MINSANNIMPRVSTNQWQVLNWHTRWIAHVHEEQQKGATAAVPRSSRQPVSSFSTHPVLSLRRIGMHN